jgi:hypothetical protein
MLAVSPYALWLLASALQCAVAYRMWARRLYRDYPLFFAYTISHLLSVPIVLYCYRLGDRDLYRNAYSGLEILYTVLKFGVICELFSRVFRQYEGIRGLGSVVLRWGTVILLLIAVIVAASSSGSDSDRFLAGLFAIERSVELVQGGLLFLLFIFSSSLGLRWQHDAWGLALGLAVVTSVELAAFTLRAQLGPTGQDVLSLVSNAAYDCAVLIWLVALYAQKAEHHFEHRIQRWDVDSWNRALLDLLRR